MAVSTQASSAFFLGNNSVSAFNFSFNNSVPFNSNTPLAGYVVTYTDISGNQTVLDPTVYTISFTAALPGTLWGIGGTLNYPLTGSPIASGTSLTLQRVFSLQQLISISNQGAFSPENIEAMGDIEEMQLQQVNAAVQRSIQIPVVDSGINVILPSAKLRANKYQAFDANGNVIVLPGTGGSPTVNSEVNPGFTNFVVPGLVAPSPPSSGLAVSLPAGQAVLNNVLLTVPAVPGPFTDNSITDYYLNPAGSSQPWTIVITPVAIYTSAVRYPNLLKVWTIQTAGGNINGINMMAMTRPAYPQNTDLALVTNQIPDVYVVTGSPTAWSSGLSVTFGIVIVTTAGNMYQVQSESGNLGTVAPTGVVPVVNGNVQLSYYGQAGYENNFRYGKNGGIQSYYGNILAALIVDLQGTLGTQMSNYVKAYLINQFRNVVTPRQNSTAYTFGQKIIAGGYIWVSQTYAGGTTSGSSPFSGSYTPGASTVVDGGITWLCIFNSYSTQKWFWMTTDYSMTIYQPSSAMDSDAATFFQALWAYIQVTGDWQWLLSASPIVGFTYLQCLQNIYDFNLATTSNFLTLTFQNNINPFTGASFTFQYTEDNCESYTGYVSAAPVFNLLGDSTRSGEAAFGAETVDSGLFALINSTYNVIGWFYGDDFSWVNNPSLAWYPWYQVQFFPELHQIGAADDVFKQGARTYVMKYWNNWPQDPGTVAELPNIMFGWIAAKYWQDIEKAESLVKIVENLFITPGLLASDFGYYLQTKKLLVNSNQLANINGIKLTFVDPAGGVYVTNQSRVFTGSGTVNVFQGDYYVGIDKGTGAATAVQITWTPTTDYLLIIKDIKGDANSNNITITPLAGNIDGAGTKVISAAYGAVKLRYVLTQAQWYSE